MEWLNFPPRAGKNQSVLQWFLLEEMRLYQKSGFTKY